MPAAPFELIIGPATVYIGPDGQVAPEISGTPTSPWQLLGTTGADTYSEDGVTFSNDQTIFQQFVLGSTAPVKAGRTQENTTVGLTIFDISAETFSRIFNDNPVTDVGAGSGTAGYRSVPFLRGPDVTIFSMIVRTFSPYGDGYFANLWIPRAYVASTGGITYSKNAVAGVELEFTAVLDQTHGIGTFYCQDAPPA